MAQICFFLPDAGYPTGLSGMSCWTLLIIRLFLAGYRISGRISGIPGYPAQPFYSSIFAYFNLSSTIDHVIIPLLILLAIHLGSQFYFLYFYPLCMSIIVSMYHSYFPSIHIDIYQVGRFITSFIEKVSYLSCKSSRRRITW